MRLFKPFQSLARGALVLAATFGMSSTFAQTVTGTGAIDPYVFDGSRDREYKVYVPQSYTGTEAVPMIFALHGCAMDNDDALNLWNFDLIADQHNVIVVFPFVTTFTEQRSENCWGYWFDQHVQEGGIGEVDDLVGIGMEVEGNYNIDPDRRYITGISSGGGMTVASGIAYNDYWAAMAPVEAPAYGDGSMSVLMDSFETLQHHVDKINAELNDDRAVPTFVVHSHNDTTVMIRGGELIRDSQLTVWGPDLGVDATRDCTQDGIDCTISTYNDADGNPLVETMFYYGEDSHTASLGKGHYWVGDDDAPTLWAEGDGPSASQYIWAFFENITLQGFDQCEDPNDTTAPVVPTGLVVVDVLDKTASLSVDANSESDFKRFKIYNSDGSEAGSSSSSNITLSGLSPESSYSVYVTAVDKCGNESGASNTVSFTTLELQYIAPSFTGTCTEHYNAGRFDVTQYTSCGSTYGYMDDVTIWQLEDGSWTYTDPNGGGGSNPTPTPQPTPTATPAPTATPTPTATPAPTPTPVPGNCTEHTSSNYAHVQAGRATVQGFWNAVAVGSGDAMGLNNTYTTTTLAETSSGYFELGNCP